MTTELEANPPVAGTEQNGPAVWPPQPGSADQFFAIKYAEGVPGQNYGQTYVADETTPNAPKLVQAVESGQPVYALIYRLAPYSSLTAWNRITRVERTTDRTRLIFHFEQYEFPVKVHYRGRLSLQLPWVANLGWPGRSVQSISQAAFETVIDWAKELERLRQLLIANLSQITTQTENRKDQFNNAAYLLLENAAGGVMHLQYEILEILQSIPELRIDGGHPENWLWRNMSDDNRFKNRGENLWVIADPSESAGGEGDNGGKKPEKTLSIARSAKLVMEEVGKPIHVADLLEIMRERGLKIPQGTLSDQRTNLSGILHHRRDTFHLEGGNIWSLVNSDQDEDDEGGVIPDDGLEPKPSVPDAPLRVLTPDELNKRLEELSQELLFDPAVVRRIYRSLVAGHHVVLSGPPGTGKTELAKRLPGLLWREVEPEQLEEQPADATDDIKQDAASKQPDYEGYYPYVVTATEDWGVRDVIGGIAPRLGLAGSGQTGLSYGIQYGELVRAVLQNYEGTDGGQRLPADPTNPTRAAYIPARFKSNNLVENEREKQYRGVWLVIDEFTRAPVDAAFGPLLTTLGNSSDRAWLSVPTEASQSVALPLPQDFRIIGTLNSYDRHFLNQISEALKRRFDFIDVLPPAPALAEAEQGIALKRALDYLQKKAFDTILAITENGENQLSYTWDGKIQLTLVSRKFGNITRPVFDPGEGQHETEVVEALNSFWRIFEAIRVFRQLGTAQAVAVYTNLFAGVLTGINWQEALDSALADTLADQLQVLNRDEQELLLAFLENSNNESAFAKSFGQLWETLSEGRQRSLAHTLREAEIQRQNDGTVNIPLLTEQEDSATSLSKIAPHLTRVFKLDMALKLPGSTNSEFIRRLRNLIHERGL